MKELASVITLFIFSTIYLRIAKLLLQEWNRLSHSNPHSEWYFILHSKKHSPQFTKRKTTRTTK